MFKKGNRVYADTYKYLRHKERNFIAFSCIGNEDEFEEVEMEQPINLRIDKNSVFWENGKLCYFFSDIDYVTMKTSIIKSRYSNDDQIALLLNKDDSEDDRVFYNKMQEWREWASWFAKEVESMVNNVENT